VDAGRSPGGPGDWAGSPPKVSRRAAIDIGTNSVRLLVADVAGDGAARRVRPVLRQQLITRLGDGLGAGRRIRPEAAARTAAAVHDYLGLAAREGAEAPVVVGTYALRAAENPEELLARLAVPVRILTGEEEARLGFAGVAAGLGAWDASLVVVDIGGGSVELAWGDGGQVTGSLSLPLGCVLLTDRFFAHDPPSQAEVDALLSHVGEMASGPLSRIPLQGRGLVGVGGTVTTVTAVAQRLSPYDPARVHGYRLTRRDVDAVTRILLSQPLAGRRELPGLQPDRADILPAGALVLQHVLSVTGQEALVVSEADLLWGALLTLGAD
jgi:exopolyphosphatase/guanosine-5'-triphosphate,3'-diphosphate pyrophosphatase